MPKIELLNIDCMDFLKAQPDKSFDLAVCDPPYGIDVAKSGKVGGRKLAAVRDYGAKEWDRNAPEIEYFKELRRVSCHQVVWGANHFIDRIAVPSSCWIVWDKDNSGNFADCELAFTSFDTAVRKFKYTWNGMLQGDMKNKEQRIHPTQKPVKLYEWLLTNYAKKGDRILDTHLGSGSSAIAAYNLGFDFVGCELDKDYYEAAEARFNKHIAQQSLFCSKTDFVIKTAHQEKLL